MSKVIMVIDDSPSIRQLASFTLKSAGFEVIEASDGQEALGKLDGSKIHLIVSDVNMPNMDGITFVREARKIPRYQFTPIMILTTESDTSKKLQGKEAGAHAWLVKPFNPDRLLKAVNKLVA